MIKTNVEKVDCVNCGKEFERWTKKHKCRGKRGKSIRGFKMNTCSPKCSRDWTKKGNRLGKCSFCGKKIELRKIKIIKTKNACKECYDEKQDIRKGKKISRLEHGISYLNEENKKEFLKEHKR